MKATPQWSRSISKYFSSSISSKIITPYLMLTLFFTAFGIFVVTQLVVVGLEERLKNQLVDASRVVSDEVVNRENLRLEIERLVTNTEGVAEAIIARDTTRLERLVSPQIANSKDIDSIILVDTQGQELLLLQRESDSPTAAVTTDTGSEVSYAAWPAVDRVLSDPDGNVKEIQLGRDPDTNRLIIYTVGPVRDETGIVGAALVGTYLSREINALHTTALADLTLFDENTNVIASTLTFSPEQPASDVFSDFDQERYQEVIERQVRQGEAITLLDEIGIGTGDEAQGYRVAYVPFILRNRVAGIYAVALPTNFITESDTNTRNQLIFVFSIGIIAVFFLGFLVSRWIANPILKLVSTSQAIAKGDLSQRTGLQLRDEIGILANTFDEMTSELQRKTVELEQEASKLNAILSSIADGVLVQDLMGNTIRMNPTAEHILEELGEDLTLSEKGAKTVDATHQEQVSLLNALTGLSFHEAQRFDMGRRILSALAAPVVTTDEERLGSVVVLRDITREVEAERLKDDFITSISHELKTPLTAVKGYLQLLKMMSASKLDEREMSWVQASEKEVGDLDNLIQKMLDLSQIDAGELGTDPEEIDLSELIEMEAENWVEKMEERDLSFEIKIPDKPIVVEGDWEKLTQVVHNLIENAHNYTLPGGKVEVLAKSENGHAQVEVVDTGVGISKEDQPFLFTRFFRAIHEESTFEISGAGLGLYMSKAFVEAHPGGKMGMESELHQGSKFYFALPVFKPDIESPTQTEPVEFVNSQH